MPSNARRTPLRSLRIQDTTHAGLWLDSYLRFQTGMPGVDNDSEAVKRARSNLIQEVTGRKTFHDYHRAAGARTISLGMPSDGILREVKVFRAPGRLVVGLGQKGVLEAGITLERTWGVPYLPGSSLKGVAAAAAHQLTDDDAWHKAVDDDASPGESFAQLFGTTERRGKVIFHDAWWLPSSGSEQPLAHDIMTVHHPGYYQHAVGDRDFVLPDGTDSPNPISFITTNSELCFVVALEVVEEDRAWLDAAWELLIMGLHQLGIGAKTNAGYGRLFLEETETTKLRADVEATRSYARAQEAFGGGSVDAQLRLLLDEFDASPGRSTYNALQTCAGQPKDARNPFAAFAESRFRHLFPNPPPANAFDVFIAVLKTHATWGPALLRGERPASLNNISSSKLKDMGRQLGLTGSAEAEASPHQALVALSADASKWFGAAAKAVALGDALAPADAEQIIKNAGKYSKKWKENKKTLYKQLEKRAKQK